MSVENAGAAPMPAFPPDKVIIQVGDQKVTFAEFEAIINSLPEQYRAQARGPARTQLVQNIVRTMALAGEGHRRKIDQSEGFKYAAAFQTQNILAGFTAEQLQKEMEIDEPTVRAYYDSHKAEFEQVHARHILIRVQGSTVPARAGQKELTDAEALAKCQELRKKIVGGADFATLAIQESDDTTSGARGGDLGFIHHQQTVPTFEQAAFNLKAGELSEPVKTQFGYHLIKVEARESKTFEEARPELEKRMKPEMVQKFMDDLVKKTPVTLDPELFAAPAPAPAATPAAPAK